MNYYRAALAAANSGCLSGAERLVRCSILLKENAPNAPRLLFLLQEQNKIAPEALTRLRERADARQYKKALRIELPKTSRAHTIRGLLYATLKCFRKAEKQFALAIALDGENNLAKQALRICSGKRGGLFDEFLRLFGR